MSTLIIYSTKHGAAKKCAELLADKLNTKADLCNLKDEKLPELSKYDSVIIGSSIYAGRVAKELNEFCTKSLNDLKEKKVGLYICCMNLKEGDNQLNNNFPKELLSSAVAKKSFGGEFKFKEMSFFEKLITRMVSKMLAKEDPNLKIDMKQDISMISKENIDEFARLMNNAG